MTETPAPAKLELAATWVSRSVTAAPTVVEELCRVRVTGEASPAPWIWKEMLVGLARVVAEAAVAPPVKVEPMAAAFAFTLALAKLPISAFETLSPASTWKAVVLEEKASCCLPLESVFTEAVMLAALKAEAAGVASLPALVMASLMAVTRELVSLTLEVLTATFARLAPEKPGPEM